jgi:hypothetical protein
MQQLLTTSGIKAYSACPRQYRYAYALGYRRVTQPDALAFGTAVHLALEAYWRSRKTGESAPAAAAFDAHAATDLLGPARARAEAMVTAYAAAWGAESVEVLEVEREFRLPLVNPATGHASPRWKLGGKIDLILRLADGRTAIVEHKTTSRDPGPGSEYRDALALDGQVSQYFLGAEALGYAPDLCLYDVLVKPAIKPLEATPEASRRYRKSDGQLDARQRERDETLDEYRERVLSAVAASPEKFLARIEVPRLEAEREEYQGDLWDLAAEIRLAERTGRARRNTAACWRYGSPCEFLPVCQKRASLEDPALYHRPGAHPELDEAGQAA